jgi:preprotein translocase subunit SecE
MARNRQRAKERQARRQAQQAGGGDQARPKREASKPPPAPPDRAPEETAPPLSESERMRLGAPPEDVGSSSEVLEFEQALETQDDDEHFDSAEDVPEEDLEHGGRAAATRERHRDRPRLVQFLVAVWAELQRVQWPNREALTTLTGVVLGFVLIAGGYLGLLDAIFSRVIQAIL